MTMTPLRSPRMDMDKTKTPPAKTKTESTTAL